MFMTFLVLAYPCCIFNLGPSKRLQCANQVAKSEWQHFLTSFWIRFVSHDFIWFHTSFHGTTCAFWKLRITSKPCPWRYLWNASLVKIWDPQCRVASWCPVDRCPNERCQCLGNCEGKMIGSTVYFYVLNVFMFFSFFWKYYGHTDFIFEISLLCMVVTLAFKHVCSYSQYFLLSRPLWPITLTSKTWLSESNDRLLVWKLSKFLRCVSFDLLYIMPVVTI